MGRAPAGTHRLARRVAAAEGGRAIGELVAEWAKALLAAEVSRARVRALLAAGAVRVDGIVARRPGQRLRQGQRVDGLLRLAELAGPARATDRPFELTRERILFEDEWLLVVDKPPGLPTHRTADPRRTSLVAHVESHLRAQGRDAYVAVHQRLDRDTSGVVLFAIARAANAALARAFAGRELSKTYVALVECRRHPAEDAFEVAVPLAADRALGRVRAVDPGGLPALTKVSVLERLGGLALLELRPLTGRKHQLRVHLAHAGLPIFGDETYGGSARHAGIEAPRALLHASRLELLHPVDGRRLRVESPLPADFTAVLRRARASR